MNLKKLLFAGRLPLLLAVGLSAAWLLRAAVTNNGAAPKATTSKTNVVLAPGPNDGKIAYVTARLLEQNHYLRHQLDDEFSEKFLDRYLETLDPQHIHFTAGDLAEFEPYRTTLDNLTLGSNGIADTTPAYKIFNRFRQRLDERVAYAQELLKTETFDFTTDERALLNRKDAPYPRDLNEAKQLWRQRLRYEYLQEKLGRAGAKTNALTIKKSAPATNSAPETAAGEKKKTESEEIVDTLNRRYNRNVHMFNEWDNDDVLEIYLTALAHVYDPHSDYFNSRQAENFSIQMSLALFGIGAELTSEDGYCTIRKLVPGGPAFKSKLITDKDRIVAVAQSNMPPVDVVDMSLNKVVQMIRGPKGTEVSLTVIPPDSSGPRRVITLVRDEIKLEDQEAKAKIIELPANGDKPVRLGVIDLPSFYATIDLSGGKKPNLAGDGGGETKATPRSTSEDVARLLAKFKREGVSGVILDLRRNGGGSLEEAVKLTGLFIKNGPVVQVAGPDDRHPQVDEDTDPTIQYDGPLIVLTSRFSASASEILAGALQDYGRALVVGDISTHGKGTVQNLNPLRFWVKPTATATNDPGALKTTIRKFYRASGASTQLRGVNPDIVLPSVLNYSKEIGESALENPLAWDTIPSAKYDKVNLVGPFLPELLQRSTDRVTTNQDFRYIHEDIEQYRKLQADKTISLNEQVRLKEKDEAEARQKARDKERLARKAADQKIYELTLKLVDQPGLPPAVAKTNTSHTVSAILGVGTNVTTASLPVTTTVNALDAEDAEETPPAVDAMLDETQRILLDYISLLAQKNLATTRPVSVKTD